MMFEKIFITGKDGAVGLPLYKSLKKKLLNSKVYGVGRSDYSKFFNTDSVNNKSALIIHSGAASSREAGYEEVLKKNIESAREIAQYMRNNSNLHLIFFSACSIFSSVDRGLIKAKDVPSPSDFYSWSKLIGELLFEDEEIINRCVTLRLPAIYGTKKDKGFLKNVVNNAQLSGKVELKNGNGKFNNAISLSGLKEFIVFLCNKEYHSVASNYSPMMLGFSPSISFNDLGKYIREKYSCECMVENGDKNFVLDLENAERAGFRPDCFSNVIKSVG